MLGLIILGIAAVAIAATALVLALTSAKKDADTKFSDKPVGDPAQPCSEKKKIKLVELVEVIERDSEGVVEQPGSASAKKPTLVTRADKDGADFKQFINIKQDCEGKPKRHPENGRFVLLRARVEWADGGCKDSLAGCKVQFKLKVEEKAKGRPATLEKADQEGLASAGGKDVLTATTDREGWTSAQKLYLSAYAGDKFSASAKADENGDGSFEGTELTIGKWVVWRRFWYQKTHHKDFAVPDPAESVTAYEKVCAEMVKANSKTFTKADAPDRTFYPDWMVNPGAGSDADAAVIGGHNRDEFYKMFEEEKDKPVKGHLILCAYQWDPAGDSGLQTFEIDKSPSDELTIDLGSWNAGIVTPPLSGSLVKTGTWRSKAPAGDADHGKNGNLSDADIQVIKGRGGLNVVKVKLPASAPDPTKHKVEVKLKLAYGKYYAGESNKHQMLIRYDGTDKKLTQVVSHEFGHGFGQTPRPGKQPKPLENHPKQYDDANGGVGSHCNTDATKKMGEAKYPTGLYQGGTCIMFHQVNPAGCKQVFCDDCDPYLRLQDFSKLS